MSQKVYRIARLLSDALDKVPIGTNQGLFSLMFTLLSGRFLDSRGAAFPTLADMGLAEEASGRAEAAPQTYARTSPTYWLHATNASARKATSGRTVMVGFAPSIAISRFFSAPSDRRAGKHYTS